MRNRRTSPVRRNRPPPGLFDGINANLEPPGAAIVDVVQAEQEGNLSNNSGNSRERNNTRGRDISRGRDNNQRDNSRRNFQGRDRSVSQQRPGKANRQRAARRRAREASFESNPRLSLGNGSRGSNQSLIVSQGSQASNRTRDSSRSAIQEGSMGPNGMPMPPMHFFPRYFRNRHMRTAEAGAGPNQSFSAPILAQNLAKPPAQNFSNQNFSQPAQLGLNPNFSYQHLLNEQNAQTQNSNQNFQAPNLPNIQIFPNQNFQNQNPIFPNFNPNFQQNLPNYANLIPNANSTFAAPQQQGNLSGAGSRTSSILGSGSERSFVGGASKRSGCVPWVTAHCRN